MSLNQLKQILDSSEAVANYSKVLQENLELHQTIKTLEPQIMALQKENSELKELNVNFAGKEITLAQFQTEQQEYTRKVYREEIERKAQEKFEADSPTLALKELDKFLQLPKKKRPQAFTDQLDAEINAEVTKILTIPSSWPPWFKAFTETSTQKEVQTRLDSLYWANIREGIRKAKEEEWNPYLDHYLQETITPFCRTTLLKRFLSQLEHQTIFLTCKQCNTQWPIQLPHSIIVKLLETGLIVIACPNPNCIEGRINRHPTRINLSLGDAISTLLGKPHMPPY